MVCVCCGRIPSPFGTPLGFYWCSQELLWNSQIILKIKLILIHFFLEVISARQICVEKCWLRKEVMKWRQHLTPLLLEEQVRDPPYQLDPHIYLQGPADAITTLVGGVPDPRFLRDSAGPCCFWEMLSTEHSLGTSKPTPPFPPFLFSFLPPFHPPSQLFCRLLSSAWG